MVSRDERMQQRLRGSSRRQVKDVDFGLVFSAPPASDSAESVASAQEIPQPELPSARRTPTTRSRAQATTTNGPAAQDVRQPVMRSGNVDANISAKRRKLDTDAEPSSSRSTRSSRNAPRPDIYALPGDEAQEPSILSAPSDPDESELIAPVPEPETEPESLPPVSQRRLRNSRTPSLPPRPIIEITESPADAPGSGHRSRISISEAVSSSLHMLQESSLASPEVETPDRRKRKRGEANPTTNFTATSQEQDDSVDQSASVDDVDELSPEQPIRHTRKPKVVPQQESFLTREQNKTSTEQEEEEEADEAINDPQTAAILKNHKGRRVSRNFQTEPSPDLDETEVEQARKTKNRRLQKTFSPVRQSHPKKTSKKAKRGPLKVKAGNEPPIVVTVHRLTKRPLYDEDESDAEILNSKTPHARRGGVNVIDVLSQVSQEVLGAGLETLEEMRNDTEDHSLRRDCKTKWQALKTFGEDLQTRLFEHTTNLDNTYSLEKRVREEQKKKLGLRDDILRVRAERQQIALQMDEIRIRHEDEGNQAQKRDTVNTTFHDVELAVDRGRAAEPQTTSDGGLEKFGLEVLLKRVGGEVSNGGHSGGILQRIKKFNTFLERAASALELKRA